MAARFTRLLVALGLLFGMGLPSAAAAVVRLPTSQETAASPVTDRGADPVYARSYFGARYYRADIGRFTTPDPGHVNWNAYAYARSNPLRYIDPDGRTYQVCAKGGDCSFVSDASWEGAMGKAGGGYLFREGYMWALVDGNWSYAGTYEQISVDSPQVNFDSMVHTTGVLADRWLRENATQMASGSGLSAVDGVVAGVVRGGLAGGATTLGVRRRRSLPTLGACITCSTSRGTGCSGSPITRTGGR